VSKNKLEKFAENKTFINFFEPDYDTVKGKDFLLKGIWNKVFFNNNNPLILELGCGRGEYTVGLAEKYPNMNFIGIDRKGARMWKGCKTSVEKNMKNVAFIRSQIGHITYYFNKEEVSEIWLTFPDPQPKRSKVNKRLTSPLFLDFYREILKKNGFIHLKTDNELLFEYTLGIIDGLHYKIVEKKSDIHSLKQIDENLLIETYYEKMWKEQGHKIYYIKFQLG